MIDTELDNLPLKTEAAGAIQLAESARQELRQRVRIILAPDTGVLEQTGWFSDAWIDRALDEAPQQFDRAFDRWQERFSESDPHRAQLRLANQW